MSIASIQSKYPNAVFYDSNHGGTNSGTLDNPYTSLATAMSNATDSVAILDGNHDEDESISAPKDLVFVGESLSAVLETRHGGSASSGGLECNGYDVTLETLTFYATGQVYNSIIPGTDGNITIDRCKVEVASSVVTWGNRRGLIGGSAGGVLTIKESLLLIGGINYGILIGGTVGQGFTDITITGNTIIVAANSTETNISSDSSFNSSVWKNNIFVGQGSEVLNFVPSTYSNNCFDNTGITSGGTDNLFATDPIFVDSANGDYRLRPSSPCIGAGTAS